MTPEPHPDLSHDYRALKAIHRGGTQAADSAAMEAYWRALESGSKDEANKVFSDTYKKFIDGIPNGRANV